VGFVRPTANLCSFGTVFLYISATFRKVRKGIGAPYSQMPAAIVHESKDKILFVKTEKINASLTPT
jgi:hypothetical protein